MSDCCIIYVEAVLRGKSGQPPPSPTSPPFPQQHPFDTHKSSNPISPGLPCFKNNVKKEQIQPAPNAAHGMNGWGGARGCDMWKPIAWGWDGAE